MPRYKRHVQLSPSGNADVFGAIPWIIVYEPNAKYRPLCKAFRVKRGRRTPCKNRAKYLYTFADGTTRTLCASHLHRDGIYAPHGWPVNMAGGEYNRLLRWQKRVGLKDLG